METDASQGASKGGGRRFGCLHVFGLLVVVAIITAGSTFFIVKAYLFPSPFKPVALSSKEEQVLAVKIEGLQSAEGGTGVSGTDIPDRDSGSGQPGAQGPVASAPYDEEGLSREVAFTERELNGLLATNTDLADKLAIDLSEDLISAKLLLPVDEDFPVLGGKVIRLRSGMAFSYENGRPVVILKGVTVMGVPVPNAWLGGMKNIDLVERFGAESGFWKVFADGIEDIRVEEGLLKIKLSE